MQLFAAPMAERLDWHQTLSQLAGWLGDQASVTVASREPARLVAQFRGQLLLGQELAPAPGEPMFILTSANGFDGFAITEADFSHGTLVGDQLRIVSQSVTLYIDVTT